MNVNYEKKYKKYKAKYLQFKNPIILNLMWINDTLCDYDYIFPPEHKGISVTENIKGWLENDYKIFFWYDSVTVTPLQLANTTDFFKNYDITFYNIRTILTGYENILPCKIYLRVDFYRLVVLNYLLEKNPWFKYLIYSDIVVSPIEKEAIINNKVLNNYQMIFSALVKGEPPGKGFENSFIVFKNEPILKNNLNNFITVAYNSLLVTKTFFRTGREKECKNFIKGDGNNELFYDFLKAFIYIQIEKIFYNRDITNIELTLKQTYPDKLIDELFGINNTTFVNNYPILPYNFLTTSALPSEINIYEKTLWSELEKLSTSTDRASIDRAFQIMHILEDGIITQRKVYNYLYPVIKVNRPPAGGRY